MSDFHSVCFVGLRIFLKILKISSMLLIVVIVLMLLIVLMVMIIRYYDLYTPNAAMIHPQIKTSPPSGVIGPKMLKGMTPITDLMLSQ